MIHCCTFLVTHMMLIKVTYDAMPDNKIGALFDLDSGYSDN